MKTKILDTVLNFKFIFYTYLILVLLIAIQSCFGGIATFNGLAYTHYNNYLIFKQSFYHLIHQGDLYALFPTEHYDYYKYSPTFALFMAPLAILPNFIGLFLWDLINALPLFLAIKYLPNINEKNRKYILWFIVLELITSLQNEQSNGLIAGLIIISFLLFERRNFFIGTLLIVFSVYVKIFGIVALALLLMYPNKIKNIGYTLFWFLILFVMPLLVVPFHQLAFLYTSWKGLLANDVSISVGYSVSGWLLTWFGIDAPKSLVLGLGVIVFCIPLFRIKLYKEYFFRLFLVASTLLWIVIFNHKAESPTFIIAICGAALWYFPQTRKTENFILIIAALVFTALSPSDIFPRFIRKEFFEPYVIKAVPCILIWFKLIWDMVFYKAENFSENIVNKW
jgi:hypothetical protein